MSKIKSAVITPVLAAGSVTSPYYYQVNITQELCYPACAEEAPVFAPQFVYMGLTQVGTGQYVATIRVQGIISYVQCGGDCGCTKTQPLIQDFTIPIASATAPTSVSVVSGNTVNAISSSPCQQCAKLLASETPLTVTVA